MSRTFKNKTILRILDQYKTVWALGRLSGLAHWDLETYMPVNAVGTRGEMLAKVSSLQQKLFLDKNFVNLIHQSEKSKMLSAAEAGVVRTLIHSLKFYEKLPAEFLEEFERLTNNASIVWREAKEKNKYKLFEPYLTKIFEMNRKMADYLGYSDSPYDALMDLFEEGLMVAVVEPFFDSIWDPLKKLLSQVLGSGKYNKDHPLEFTAVNIKKLMDLNNKILRTFWSEFGKNFRLDISAHPFTTSFSNTDTRITTWYHESDFARSVLSTVHEFGHALYDLQCSNDFEATPIQGGSSLVIHESQSRFWENFIGRSESFISKFIHDMRGVTGRNLSIGEVYRYFNKVSPGLIRTEADEVTYHFHIMLRFDIEKGMIEGKLKAKDLREIWNAKMKEYLGLVPSRDSDGILQDVHWSMGSVGYFPTYSLGTFLAAEWAEKLNKELRIMNYAGIEKWLASHIHQYGSTYTLQDLLAKNKMKFDPKVNLKYLEEKYSKIYSL